MQKKSITTLDTCLHCDTVLGQFEANRACKAARTSGEMDISLLNLLFNEVNIYTQSERVACVAGGAACA
jgi:hypothetical protein